MRHHSTAWHQKSRASLQRWCRGLGDAGGPETATVISVLVLVVGRGGGCVCHGWRGVGGGRARARGGGASVMGKTLERFHPPSCRECCSLMLYFWTWTDPLALPVIHRTKLVRIHTIYQPKLEMTEAPLGARLEIVGRHF